jgi:hypothetical protein
VLESLFVDLGHRPSSSFGKNFYRLPFTPPSLWSPNRSFSAEVRRGRPHEAALIEGAAGDWERSDGDE